MIIIHQKKKSKMIITNKNDYNDKDFIFYGINYND